MQPAPAPSSDWPLSVPVRMQASYRQNDPDLDSLYRKAKTQQWDVDDFDWSHEFDRDNPLSLPDRTLIIYGSALWDRLSTERRAEARCHFQAWTMSQILHGEQGALLCATKLAQGEHQLSARLCAAAQAFDEARHIEACARLVNDKVGFAYPLSRSLHSLLRDTVCSSELDITNLGMQILVEGIALSLFQTIVGYSRDEFVKSLLTRIQQDEARHFAVGSITLTRLYSSELSSAELRVREEFVCESIVVLYEHLCADDIWEPLGHSRKECATLVRKSPVADALRRSLFRRLVPAIRNIGLAGPRVGKVLESLNLLDYLQWPLATEPSSA